MKTAILSILISALSLGSSLSPGTFGIDQRASACTDTWTPTSTTNAPGARSNHTAVWTGSEMIVWGGYNGSIGPNAKVLYFFGKNVYELS